jgi:hypothetical protein
MIKNNYSLKFKKIPPINKTNENIFLFNNIFGYKHEKINDQIKLIFLEQPYHKSEDIELQNIVISLIDEIIGRNNYLIKLHPSTPVEKYKGFSNLFPSSYPMEILNLNLDMHNKLLITINSTACITPKIVFDEEPKLIYLSNLLPRKNIKYNNEFVYKMSEIYEKRQGLGSSFSQKVYREPF